MKNAKKLMALLLVGMVACTLLFSLPGSADAITLDDPGFEYGGEGWSLPVPAKMQVVSDNPTYAPQGTKYLKVTCPTQFYSQRFPVEPGVRYELSYQLAYADTVSQNGFTHMFINMFNEAGESVEGWTSEALYYNQPTDSLWRATRYSFVAPESAAMAGFSIRSLNGASTTLEMYLDDLQIRTKRPDGENFIENATLDNVANNLPTGFTYVGGTAGVNYMSEEVDGDKKLKLTNTDPAGTVYAECYVPAVKNLSYEFSTDFNLTALEAGSAGASMEVYTINNQGGWDKLAAPSTTYFTATDAGWRKMLGNDGRPKDTVYQVRFILTGAGTVYFDNFSAKITMLSNGDFEGLKGENVAGGSWVDSAGTAITVTTDPAADGKHGKVALMPASNYAGIYKPVTLDPEKIYKLTFDCYAAGTYGPIMCLSSSKGIAGVEYGQFLPSTYTGDTWVTKTYYFKPTAATYYIILAVRGTPIVYYDNISLTECVHETVALYKNGISATTLTGGDTVTASYTGFSDDFTLLGKTVSLVTVLYKKDENGALTMATIDIQTGNAPIQNLLPNRLDGDGTSGKTLVAGKVPLELSKTITVPNDGGTYVAKTFAWNGLASVTPFLRAASAATA